MLQRQFSLRTDPSVSRSRQICPPCYPEIIRADVDRPRPASRLKHSRRHRGEATTGKSSGCGHRPQPRVMVGRSGRDLLRTGIARRGCNGAFGYGRSKVHARSRPALYGLHALCFEPLSEFRRRGCHVARFECCNELGLPARHGNPRAIFVRQGPSGQRGPPRPPNGVAPGHRRTGGRHIGR